jgi:hypothetical protein
MGTISSKKLEVKRGNAPDEARPFAAHGHADIHNFGNGVVMHGVFEPGWKWSIDVKPIAGTDSCQAPHLCYVISGRMRLRTDNGEEEEVGPGDFFKLSPGHDAWVVGSEACRLVDFAGYEQYAKAMAAPASRPERGSPASAGR